MKVLNILIITFFCVFLMACNAKDQEEFYDENFLKENIIDYDPNSNFNTVFPEFKDYFHLSDDELKIVGMWEKYDPDIDTSGATIWNFIFYPNNFAIIEYLGSDKIFGIWLIEKNWLKIKIYSYRQINENNNYIYKTIMPYTVKVSKLENIDSKGFTRKRFKLIKLLKEINKFTGDEHKQIEMHRYRLLYYLDIGRDSPYPPPRYFSYFEHIPEMVNRDLKGEEIAQNVKLIKEILGN